jgi:hypothetical protein
MRLMELLNARQAEIVGRWRQLVFESYPEQTAIFLANEKDGFSNPVGYRLSQGLKSLWGSLLKGTDRQGVEAGLDDILGIKALQDAAPSRGLAFIFLLKQVIREELGEELADAGVARELQEFEDVIDGVALLGFDIFTKRRERLCDIRVEEVKRSVSGLMRKAGFDLANL